MSGVAFWLFVLPFGLLFWVLVIGLSILLAKLLLE